MVVALDGAPVSMIDLWHRQRTEGTLHLRVRRGDHERDVALVARSLI